MPGGNEHGFAGIDCVANAFFAGRGDLAKVEAGAGQPVADIGAVAADVIPLAEVEIPAGLRRNRRIFVGAFPALDDRHHDDRRAAGTEAAAELSERLPVVPDMFEDMGHDEDINAPRREVDVFKVELQIGRIEQVRRTVIGGESGQHPSYGRLGREVNHRASNEPRIPVKRELEQAMAFEATALRAHCIPARRIAKGFETAGVAANRAFARVRPRIFPKRVCRRAQAVDEVAAEQPASQSSDEATHTPRPYRRGAVLNTMGRVEA